MSKGITYVSKAKMWQVYTKEEGKDVTNWEEWFATKEEAEKKLREEE